MDKEKADFILIFIVLDDMAFASNSVSLLEAMKQKRQARYDVSLFGQVRSFIGWAITRTPSGIKIHQSTYIRSLLTKYGLSEANPFRTPLPTNADFGSASDDEEVLDLAQHYVYRALIDGLLYFAVSTRPELPKTVGSLSLHVHNPTPRHLTLSTRALRYLIGIIDFGIH